MPAALVPGQRGGQAQSVFGSIGLDRGLPSAEHLLEGQSFGMILGVEGDAVFRVGLAATVADVPAAALHGAAVMTGLARGLRLSSVPP